MSQNKVQSIGIISGPYYESRVDIYGNDNGLHKNQIEKLPNSFYNNQQVKVEKIKKETVRYTHNLKHLFISNILKTPVLVTLRFKINLSI